MKKSKKTDKIEILKKTLLSYQKEYENLYNKENVNNSKNFHRIKGKSEMIEQVLSLIEMIQN